MTEVRNLRGVVHGQPDLTGNLCTNHGLVSLKVLSLVSGLSWCLHSLPEFSLLIHLQADFPFRILSDLQDSLLSLCLETLAYSGSRPFVPMYFEVHV
jgi:hypothetical protein